MKKTTLVLMAFAFMVATASIASAEDSLYAIVHNDTGNIRRTALYAPNENKAEIIELIIADKQRLISQALISPGNVIHRQCFNNNLTGSVDVIITIPQLQADVEKYRGELKLLRK